MNLEQAKQILPIIQGFIDGKQIQVADEVTINGVVTKRWRDVDELPDFGYFFDATASRLKPEAQKAWYRVVLKSSKSGFYTMSVDDEKEEDNEKNQGNFVCWLTDRIEYQLPEGDA